MRLIALIMMMIILVQPVHALDLDVPTMPEAANEYWNEDKQSFSEGLLSVLWDAIDMLQPAFAEAAATCLSLIVIAILTSVVRNFSTDTKGVTELVSALTVSLLLLQPSNSLLQLGMDTVRQISEYGKLLLPAIASAAAAQGAPTTSAALYTGTALFNSLLSSGIEHILVPALYIYLCLCVAEKAISEELIMNIKNTIKWAMTWLLKTTLYIFTGYLSISGVISGSADAAAIKAAKLTMSGAVPVVGSIIADASETVLVSAGFIKNSIGVCGLLAILGICVGPFIKIGAQYLLLKLTSGVCEILCGKSTAALVRDFSGGMGFVLAMTGTVCVLFLVSTVCFMKGVS